MKIRNRLVRRFREPLPEFYSEPVTRWLCRGVTALSDLFIEQIEGLDNIAPDRDPFLLVSNHGQRPEAVLVPTRLIFERGGRQIRYVADWNFMMVPGVATLFRRNRVLVVSNKSARPRVLNRFKDRHRQPGSVLQRMESALRAGQSVGVFPEGTINRDPDRLLAGRPSVARMSLRTGVPVVPMGIRYLGSPGRPTRDLQRFRLSIGAPIEPSWFGGGEENAGTAAMHIQIMQAIARLSGKRPAAPGTSGLRPEPTHGPVAVALPQPSAGDTR